MKIQIGKLFQVALLATAVSACSTNPQGEIVDSQVIGNAVDSAGLDGGSQGISGMKVFSREDLNDPQSLLAQRVIYFDFDRAEARGEFQNVISAHGQYLATFPNVRVRLEGHTDERGARDYNLALGERRATSVSRLLGLQGAGSNQMSRVSYGEEEPVAYGHDENAWSQNRRVVIVYEQQ